MSAADVTTVSTRPRALVLYESMFGNTRDVAIGEGLREWIGGLERARRRIDVAAFDTKLRRPPLPGSAARAALRRLRRLGFSELGPATTFYVAATEGPPVAGELARARQWGRVVGDVAAARLAVSPAR